MRSHLKERGRVAFETQGSLEVDRRVTRDSRAARSACPIHARIGSPLQFGGDRKWLHFRTPSCVKGTLLHTWCNVSITLILPRDRKF